MKEILSKYQEKKKKIEQRLKEFKNLNEEEMFYESCFCLLTPQSNGRRCWGAVLELKSKKFLEKQFNPESILATKTRFHKTKAKYLLQAKEKFYNEVLPQLKKEKDPQKLRLFLLENVKGFGLKEVNHYLRNIGYENLAILDRHILKNLVKYKVIEQLPKTLTLKTYLEIESKFKQFSSKLKIPMDHLDLLFWSSETGEIFK